MFLAMRTTKTEADRQHERRRVQQILDQLAQVTHEHEKNEEKRMKHEERGAKLLVKAKELAPRGLSASSACLIQPRGDAALIVFCGAKGAPGNQNGFERLEGQRSGAAAASWRGAKCTVPLSSSRVFAAKRLRSTR